MQKQILPHSGFWYDSSAVQKAKIVAAVVLTYIFAPPVLLARRIGGRLKGAGVLALVFLAASILMMLEGGIPADLDED